MAEIPAKLRKQRRQLEIARTVTFSGWSAGNSTDDRKVRATISKKLVDFHMPPRGDLFDAVYEYVAEHY